MTADCIIPAAGSHVSARTATATDADPWEASKERVAGMGARAAQRVSGD